MDRNTAQKIAEKYAKSIHKIFDLVFFAGEKDNGFWFVIESTHLRGVKAGLPRVVKIDQDGNVLPTHDLKIIVWAIKEIRADVK